MTSYVPPAAGEEPVEVETARPSVTLTRNSKGACQWVVKVYGIDASADSAFAAAALAQRIYDDLAAKYGSGG